MEWIVSREDVERVKVVAGDHLSKDCIAFMPEGYVGPVKFRWGARCGIQMNSPGISLEVSGMGGGVITHSQARALLAFLREHEDMLTDPDPKASDTLSWSPDGPPPASP